MMEVDDLKPLIEAIRSTPNRGDVHIFLGDPRSDAGDKTTVEPGNSYSPGIFTCGISVWVARDGHLYTPDRMEAGDIDWRFAGEGGMPPIVEAGYDAGPDVSVKHLLTHLGTAGTNGADFNTVTVSAGSPAEIHLFIAVRDIGPAGGKIEKLTWDAGANLLTVNDGPRLSVEQKPYITHIAPAGGAHDSPVAVIGYSLSLSTTESFTLSFKTEHGSNSYFFANRPSLRYPFSGLSVAEGFQKSHDAWRDAVPARVFCPDERLTQAWERSAYHIQAAMETGMPRISAVNYPEFWLRDCIYILRSLDLIGRHDLARIGCDYLASIVFIGGFGAEGDAPGEGIWTLVKHAEITQDTNFLREVFLDIKKRIAWLERMITTTEPLRLAAPNRLSFLSNAHDTNLICMPAQNGLIFGRMDGHWPLFFINCWAFAGWNGAAKAARLLGENELAEKWQKQAEAVDNALAENLLPIYDNDRDPIISPYPSGALLGHTEQVKNKFEAWYRKNRLTEDGSRKPEMEWTYFELGQINNAVMLGFKDLGWVNLDGMLGDRFLPGKDGISWDLGAFCEGPVGGNEFLPYRNDRGMRGWLRNETAYAGNMPHNWTAAQMVLLIRNIFVTDEPASRDEAADEIVLGRGVPKSWLVPGARWGVENMPTRFGPVSYTATMKADGSIDVDYGGPENYRIAFQ